MADDKLKAGPESPGEGSVGDAQTVTKPPVPETVEEPAAGTGPVRQPERLLPLEWAGMFQPSLRRRLKLIR